MAAPLRIVRSASEDAKTRAGTIRLLAAVGIIIAADIAYSIIRSASRGWPVNGAGVYYSISSELIMLAGIGFALSLYEQGVPLQPAFQPNPVVMES